MKLAKELGVTAFAAAFGLGALAMGASLADAAPRTSNLVWMPCATTKVSADRPDPADCDASQITVNRDNSVEFTGTAGKTANIEALVLDTVLLEDSTLSFQYSGPCGGGSPRLYVTIGGEVRSTGDATEPCGPAGEGFRTVTYKLPVGGKPTQAKVGGWDVAAAGLVFDSGQAGRVLVKDVKIGGVPVNFHARRTITASPSATVTATATATPTTTSSPTTKPSTTTKAPTTTAPAPSQSTSSAGLPVTGDSAAKTGLVVGAILVVVGGAAIAVARRRRDRFEA